MYGGDRPYEEAAMKVANLELQGLMHFSACNIKQLRFPLVIINHFSYVLARNY
jgi:hypothetical protein